MRKISDQAAGGTESRDDGTFTPIRIEEDSLLSAGLWTPLELMFESSSDYANPFTEVQLTVTFVGPSGVRIERPCFWDGGRRWGVRFAPTEIGEWTFSSSTLLEDKGLDSISGSIKCQAADGTPDTYAHGFLRAAPTGRHLEYRDATPFFWLGDTHWRFAWEEWDRSNKPGWSSQFRDTIDLRVKQGFSVYQSNLMSWTPPPFWKELVENGRLDVSFFQNELDPRFAYIASSGLVHAVGLGWYDAIDTNPGTMIDLARYVVARYGAYPIVWTLAGEVAGYEPEHRSARLNGWREVAKAIRQADGYDHPMTAHLTNERPMPADFQDEGWLTFTLSQLGHGDLDMGPAHWLDHRDAHPGKPLVEGESFYEGLISVESTARRPVSDTMVRQVAYRAIQSGCCGYSYGAQGIWNGAWDAKTSSTMWGSLPWHEGIDLPGAFQLGHLRRFYESLDWTQLEPAPEVFQPNSWTNEVFYPPRVSSNRERTTVVIYFGETYRHDEGHAQVIGLPGVPFTVEWFDPRLGTISEAACGGPSANGNLDVPMPPSDGDWVLLLRAHQSQNDQISQKETDSARV